MRKASEQSQRAVGFDERRDVEGARAGVEPDQRGEKDGRWDEGVEEELDSGAAAVFGAAKGGDHQR